MRTDTPLFLQGMETINDIIARYALQPHPEGGHYRETYRSPLTIKDEHRGVTRRALTAIHFLLEQGGSSRWHQVRSDEVWHHAGGGPVELLLLDPDLQVHQHAVIGRADEGNAPYQVVPAHWWQAARAPHSYGLCSCFVAPGFDFADFCLMEDENQRQVLRERWPALAGLL